MIDTTSDPTAHIPTKYPHNMRAYAMRHFGRSPDEAREAVIDEIKLVRAALTAPELSGERQRSLNIRLCDALADAQAFNDAFPQLKIPAVSTWQ